MTKRDIILLKSVVIFKLGDEDGNLKNRKWKAQK